MITVPKGAIIQRGQMEMAFVVQNGTASLRLVRSGKTIEDKVQILAGLSPGESIACEGVSSLRDGQPVEARS